MEARRRIPIERREKKLINRLTRWRNGESWNRLRVLGAHQLCKYGRMTGKHGKDSFPLPRIDTTLNALN